MADTKGIGPLRNKLAALLRDQGFNVGAAMLVPAKGKARFDNHGPRWNGWGMANGWPGLAKTRTVQFKSLHSMTACVQRGIYLTQGVSEWEFYVWAKEAADV